MLKLTINKAFKKDNAVYLSSVSTIENFVCYNQLMLRISHVQTIIQYCRYSFTLSTFVFKIVAGLYKYPNLSDTYHFKGDKDKRNRLIIFPISNGVFFISSIISHINEQDLKQSNHKIYVYIYLALTVGIMERKSKREKPLIVDSDHILLCMM